MIFFRTYIYDYKYRMKINSYLDGFTQKKSSILCSWLYFLTLESDRYTQVC